MRNHEDIWIRHNRKFLWESQRTQERNPQKGKKIMQPRAMGITTANLKTCDVTIPHTS